MVADMETMMIGILCFILGLQVGWFNREIFRVLKRLYLSQKQQISGIVRPSRPEFIKPVSKGVVKSKSPKEIAMENERNFRDEVGI
jgi:hypothetical protein